MLARPPPVPVTVLVGVCEVNPELKLKLLGPSLVNEVSAIRRYSMPILMLCLPTNLASSALTLCEW